MLAGCVESGPPSAAPEPLPVEAVRVERVSERLESRSYSGTLEAHRVTELAFELDGVVEEVLVDEGAQVEAGALLARLDTRMLDATRQELLARRTAAAAQLAEMEAGPLPEEIDSARAEVASLRAQLELLESRRERRRRLLSGAAISPEEFEDATQLARSARAKLDAAQKQLELLLNGTRSERKDAQRAAVKQLDAQLAQIDLKLEKARLAAPYAGAIDRRYADEGQVMAAGTPLLRLVQTRPLQARIRVPVDAARELRVGQPYTLRIAGRQRRATLTAVSAELDLATRSVELVLVLDPGADAGLFPGELAELELHRTVVGEGFWLPSTALTGDVRGLWSCLILEEAASGSSEGAASEKLFRTRREDLLILHAEDDRMFVRGAVPAGALVVKSGLHRLAPGQWVTLREWEK